MVEETVSLQALALDVILLRFKLKDDNSCLSISTMSLRAVHVLAIALQGLLRSALGLHLSDMEKDTLRNTAQRHATVVEDVDTTRLEAAEGSNTGNQAIKRQRNNDEKQKILYEKYVKSYFPDIQTVTTLRRLARRLDRGTATPGSDDDSDWMNGGI